MCRRRLPLLTDDVTKINGYTQPGASAGNRPRTGHEFSDRNRWDRKFQNNGLNVTSSGNEIRGLAMFGFFWEMKLPFLTMRAERPLII